MQSVSKRIKTTSLGLFKHTVVWIFSLVYMPILIIACLVVSRQRRSFVGPLMTRGWGHSVLYLAGVKVNYTDEAREALSKRTARVLTFNHGSTLDVLLGASLLPNGGVLALKAEMRTMPILGRGAVALGSIFLDRANRERAYATLRESAQRIQAETLQVLIAPEGTRSDDGQLGRFKLGAFHLAHEAKVPILPIVLHGAAEIWPRSQLAPLRGAVTIDVLPEFLVSGETPESIRVSADQLREMYLATLTTPHQDAQVHV
jgi:putative phosphoserine phosphatase/1-acylglycerol-3-phosphate O-acyltransferase